MKAAAKKPRRFYKLADGSRAVGVTTILGVLDKPALLGWAYRTGIDAVAQVLRTSDVVTFADLDALRESPAWRKQRDAAADAGTYAHAIVSARLLNEEAPELPFGMSDTDAARAEACAMRVIGWIEAHGAKVLHAEIALVSENWRVGGTPDLVVELDDVVYVVDLKTGKRAYDEVILQLAAYRAILAENGIASATRGLILSAPIDGAEVTPLVIDYETMLQGEQVFSALVEVYRARQALTLDKVATEFVAQGGM